MNNTRLVPGVSRDDTDLHDAHVDSTPIEGTISMTQMCEGIEMDGTGCPSCVEDGLFSL